MVWSKSVSNGMKEDKFPTKPLGIRGGCRIRNWRRYTKNDTPYGGGDKRSSTKLEIYGPQNMDIDLMKIGLERVTAN